MKISNASQHYINQSYASTSTQANAQANAQGKPAEGAPSADSINLSATTRDLQKISAASELPQEERVRRVEALREQVQANQYTVNAEQVAEKLIGSIMDEVS